MQTMGSNRRVRCKKESMVFPRDVYQNGESSEDELNLRHKKRLSGEDPKPDFTVDVMKAYGRKQYCLESSSGRSSVESVGSTSETKDFREVSSMIVNKDLSCNGAPNLKQRRLNAFKVDQERISQKIESVSLGSIDESNSSGHSSIMANPDTDVAVNNRVAEDYQKAYSTGPNGALSLDDITLRECVINSILVGGYPENMGYYGISPSAVEVMTDAMMIDPFCAAESQIEAATDSHRGEDSDDDTDSVVLPLDLSSNYPREEQSLYRIEEHVHKNLETPPAYVPCTTKLPVTGGFKAEPLSDCLSLNGSVSSRCDDYVLSKCIGVVSDHSYSTTATLPSNHPTQQQETAKHHSTQCSKPSNVTRTSPDISHISSTTRCVNRTIVTMTSTITRPTMAIHSSAVNQSKHHANQCHVTSSDRTSSQANSTNMVARSSENGVLPRDGIRKQHTPGNQRFLAENRALSETKHPMNETSINFIEPHLSAPQSAQQADSKPKESSTINVLRKHLNRKHRSLPSSPAQPPVDFIEAHIQSPGSATDGEGVNGKADYDRLSVSPGSNFSRRYSNITHTEASQKKETQNVNQNSVVECFGDSRTRRSGESMRRRRTFPETRNQLSGLGCDYMNMDQYARQVKEAHSRDMYNDGECDLDRPSHVSLTTPAEGELENSKHTTRSHDHPEGVLQTEYSSQGSGESDSQKADNMCHQLEKKTHQAESPAVYTSEASTNQMLFLPTDEQGNPQLCEDGTALLYCVSETPTGDRILLPVMGQHSPQQPAILVVSDASQSNTDLPKATEPKHSIAGSEDCLIPLPVVESHSVEGKSQVKSETHSGRVKKPSGRKIKNYQRMGEVVDCGTKHVMQALTNDRPRDTIKDHTLSAVCVNRGECSSSNNSCSEDTDDTRSVLTEHNGRGHVTKDKNIDNGERIKDVGYMPVTGVEAKKRRYQETSTSNDNNDGLDYYKERNRQLEETVQTLERKIEQLEEDNNVLKRMKLSHDQSEGGKNISRYNDISGMGGNIKKENLMEQETDSASYRNIADMQRLSQEKVTSPDSTGDEGSYVERGNISKRKEDPMIELAVGSGIFIRHSALAKCRLKCKGSGTMLTRFLLEEFFEQDKLASSSAAGRGHAKRPPLDPVIISALIAFVKIECPSVTESELMQAINQKCTDVRKKQRKHARHSAPQQNMVAPLHHL